MAGEKRYDPARRAAVAALLRVHKGGWAGMAAGALAWPGADARGRAFAGALFFGTAERLATLDFLLGPFLKKPPEGLDAEVRAILECGLYQLLYMQVPQSAAVDESVKLARAFGKGSAAGLVNAVLRRCAERYGGGQGQGPDLSSLEFADERQRVCVTWSVSGAVADAVMAALPGEYDDFLAASFSTGELCLRANTLKTGVEALEERLARQGAAVRRGTVPGALYARMPGGVEGEAAFAEGLYHVQGEASQYACALVGAAPGMQVLDVCAAPGGKSATLAQMLGGGAGLTACDIRPHRVELIDELFGRLGITDAQVLQRDAAAYDEALAGQDRVLCDVPCSGLGVLGQKPDLRYAGGENFAALPALQLKVLRNAARYVKKGGRLVYATCTVRPEENGDVVRKFLEETGAFAPVAPQVVPVGAVAEGCTVTLLPNRTGLDGFFVATMERM